MHLLSNPSPSSSSRSRAQLHSTKVGKGHEPDNLKIPVHDSLSLSAKSGVGIACSPPFCDRWVPAESARFGEGVGEGVCLQTLAPRGNVLFACLTFDSIARSLCLALYTLALSLAPGALPSWVFTARTCPQCFQAHHIRLGPEPSHPSSSGCATAATYRLSLKFCVYQTCGVSARFPACKRALWEKVPRLLHAP